MERSKQELVDAFFEAYFKRDLEGMKEVMSENVTWYFVGQNKLAGTKKGLDELIVFFDKMGSIMNDSMPTIKKLIVASNDDYLIECQHIKTNRVDGINIEHYVTVLWTFGNGKIVSGRHFFADPKAVDNYFNSVPISSINLFGFNPLIIEQTYNTTIKKVWKAITELSQMRKWYFDSMHSFKPEIGFETEFNVNANGLDYLHIWRVTEVEIEKKITYSWKFGGYPGTSLVTFELTNENNFTKLRLSEVGIESFPKDNSEFSRESRMEGWNYFIQERLKTFLENNNNTESNNSLE